MEDITTKIDGSQLTSNEFNQIVNEVENPVKSSSQTLSASDQTQLSKTAAELTGRQNLVTDSGAANNYVLSVPSPFKPTPGYFDGMVITFPPGNVNTGSSVLNYATLGSKSILINGNELIGGELSDLTTVRYSASLDAFQLTHVRGRLIIGGNMVAVEGHNINTLTSTGDSFNISTQSNDPKGIFFKDDGTKMYVLDVNDKSIYQYSLIIPWVLSSAVYDSVSLSVTTETSSPWDLFIGDSGSEVYVADRIDGVVYQYSLSTAWDMSTGSFTTSRTVSAQDPLPESVLFNATGTKMYIVGTNDTIFQYTLSTPWSVNTATYDTVSFSVASESGAPRDLSFNSDGTKLFMLSSSTTNKKVYQYSLSTAYDISTTSYDNISALVGDLDANPLGFYFKPDGHHLFISGNTNDEVYKLSSNILY